MERACYDKASKRKAFSRSFRRQVHLPDNESIGVAVHDALHSAIGRVVKTAISAATAAPLGDGASAPRQLTWGNPPMTWAIYDKASADVLDTLEAGFDSWKSSISSPIER